MGSDHSNTNRTILFADPPGSSTYVYQEVPVAKLNDEIMDLAFVKLVDTFNFPGGLRALIRDHRFDEHGVNLGDHWKHKYLVDTDGMGYSGRFFSFLESDSAVVKASVYREFYGEWIQPWFVWRRVRNVFAIFLTAALDHLTGCITSRSQRHIKRFTTSTHSSLVLQSRPCRQLIRRR